MADSPSDRLSSALEGRYAIEREIGQGGMATVYRARDLKHNRRVALKVLKPELAAVVGAERFLAEIETTANLQHPNILPLYDSGEADTFLYYVMPYVEGETLRDRLDAEKQLPVDEAVRIATAVANALDFAHGHGVVHRDIKPGNILFQGGQPVVGDFGIALAVGAGGGARLTETGLSVGTPFYMSPEQATGDQHVGPRSDIYSLGCVLFEMLVGDPPYLGSTAQAVLGQIISGKPVTTIEKRSAVPAHVDAAVRKALEKVPADRFAKAADLAGALANPAFRHGEAVGTTGPDRARPWKIATAVSAAAALGAVGWAALRPAGEAGTELRRYRLEPLADLESIRGLDLSPDGSSLAWTLAGDPDDPASSGLLLQRWDGLTGTHVAGTEGANGVCFSPDGRSVAFMADGDLKVVDLGGGRPRTIRAGIDFARVEWGDDGYIYGSFTDTHRPTILRVPEGGGEPEEVTTPVAGRRHWLGSPLPEGRGLLYQSRAITNAPDADSVAVLDLRNGEQRVLVRGSRPWYSPSGHVVYLVEGRLTVARFDLEKLRITGEPSVVTDGVLTFGGSRSGSIVYAEGAATVNQPEVVWLGRDGTESVVEWDFRPGPHPQDPALSPDGSRLALAIDEGGGFPIIHVRNLLDGTTTRLGPGVRMTWSADGREIGFGAPGLDGDPDGTFRLFRQRADGSAPPVPVSAPGPGGGAGRWSLGRPRVGGTPTGLRVMEPGDSVPRVILDGLGPHYRPTLSPDGRWVAFEALVSDESRIFVRPYPDVASALHPISLGDAADPQWSADGRTLYYEARLPEGGKDITAAHLRTEPDFQVLSRELFAPFQRGYTWTTGGWLFTVAPDGERALVSRWKDQSVESGGMVLVENFAEELRRRGRD